MTKGKEMVEEKAKEVAKQTLINKAKGMVGLGKK